MENWSMNGKMLMKPQDNLAIIHLVSDIVAMAVVLTIELISGMLPMYTKDLFGNMLKRYEYWTREGKAVTPWFEWKSDICPKWQLDGKLRNFYKDE